MKIGFKIKLENHKNNHANSIVSIISIFTDFGIERKLINKIMKEMATIYSRLVNQNMYKNHIIFPASFYQFNEEDERSDKIDLNISLNTNQNLAESDISNIDVKSHLEHQIQIHETKVSEWIFAEIDSMKKRFL